jgi:hypothetical protein
MPKIVLAGQDVRLLETRGEVLKKAGARVVCCFGEQAFDVVTSEAPDLLVICHTIADKDAEAIADMAHAYCPKTRVLLMLSQLVENQPHADGRFDATSKSDPAQLVERAAQLLSWLTRQRVKEIMWGRREHLVL